MTEKKRRSDSSANVLMLQEIWKKAMKLEEGVRFETEGRKEAFALKAKFYNAVRNVKDFPDEYPGLYEAVMECEIVHEGEDNEVVVLRRKSLSPLMVSLRAQLEAQGIQIEDSAIRGTPKGKELQSSADRVLDRLLGQLQEPAGSATSTPSTTVASPLNPEQGNPPPPPLPGGHNPFFSRG